MCVTLVGFELQAIQSSCCRREDVERYDECVAKYQVGDG
jgi:hypothetical protein